MGILEAILGTDAPDEENPSDAILKDILSYARPSSKAEPMSADNGTGIPNEVMGMPPEIAAKVVGNPASYPNLAAILGGKQTKVPPRRPLDYLIAAASPLISGFAQMAMSRRRQDRKANFFSGLAQGGLGVLQNEATRTQRMQQAQREKDIQDILLQKTVRGNPIAGVDPDGKPVYVYGGTGETLPGIAPEPKTPPNVETRERKDANGNTILEQFDRKRGVWIPAVREETAQDATGKTITSRVPFVTPKQKPQPKRELKVGSDVQGGKKNDEEYYWVSDDPNQKPQPTGLFRAASDRPTREGDINRAERNQINQWAVKALADSHQRLGPGKKPEEYVNDAVETFRQAAGTSKDLASKASEVTNAIRTTGRSVKSGDELAQLVQALLGDTATKK